MSFGSLSYRNGKYQGLVHNGQRHGLGILIDDDLTFHASHWYQNKMQGPTLVYLAHAKYIYGEWKNNQPHGLNVYRSGDTVLLSKYVFGVPVNRCLLIFQRHGFACVLAETNNQWQVIKSGQLTNHSSLMKFIELLQVDVPEHYLSLIKFSCAFSSYHNSIKTFPCFQNYCYFGYINGLAIVFNSNNGLVTVGQHKNEQLCEFGGKFASKRAAQEGNFATGETVQYKGERPVQKIYQIYQRIHRKDNYVNEVYQSKTKIFNSIQSLIINKFKAIVEDSKKENVQRFDLNQSLDYQEYNQEESFKLEKIRDRMYSPPKKTFEKIKEQSTPIKKEVFPVQGESLLKSLRKSVMNELETSTKNKEEKEVKRGYQQQKQQRSIGLTLQSNSKPYKENNDPSQLSNPPKFARINSLISSFSHKKTQSLAIPHDFLKENPKTRDEQHQNHTKTKFCNSSPTSYFKQDSNRLEETSSFKKIIEEEQLLGQQEIKQGENCKQRLQRKRSIDQFARPTYEDIQERRKRILRDFEELNSQSPNKIIKTDKKPINDSPYRQDLISIQQQDQSSFGYIPLSISNKINQKKDKSTTSTTKPRIQQKPPQQQNSDSYERCQQKSSKRRANYNYTNLDSRTLNSEARELPNSQSKPQESPSPIRPKRAYQYMYE